MFLGKAFYAILDNLKSFIRKFRHIQLSQVLAGTVSNQSLTKPRSLEQALAKLSDHRWSGGIPKF